MQCSSTVSWPSSSHQLIIEVAAVDDDAKTAPVEGLHLDARLLAVVIVQGWHV
jgi:hypothetical protein